MKRNVDKLVYYEGQPLLDTLRNVDKLFLGSFQTLSSWWDLALSLAWIASQALRTNISYKQCYENDKNNAAYREMTAKEGLQCQALTAFRFLDLVTLATTFSMTQPHLVKSKKPKELPQVTDNKQTIIFIITISQSSFVTITTHKYIRRR